VEFPQPPRLSYDERERAARVAGTQLCERLVCVFEREGLDRDSHGHLRSDRQDTARAVFQLFEAPSLSWPHRAQAVRLRSVTAPSASAVRVAAIVTAMSASKEAPYGPPLATLASAS